MDVHMLKNMLNMLLKPCFNTKFSYLYVKISSRAQSKITVSSKSKTSDAYIFNI